MRLYKFFLIIAIFVCFNGCKIYYKIFKKREVKEAEKIEPSRIAESKNKVPLSPSTLQENTVLEKEEHHLKFNTLRDELIIKYSSKAYFQDNASGGILYISLPFHSTVLEAKVVDSFSKALCANSKNLTQLPEIDVATEIFKKHYLLTIQCSEKVEYMDFTLIYTLPLNMVSLHFIKNKLYVIKVDELLVTPYKNKYKSGEKKISVNIREPYTLFFSGDIKITGSNLYEGFVSGSRNDLLAIAKLKRINVKLQNASAFRINGRYNLSKIKTVATLVNKVLSFFRVLFNKKKEVEVNIIFHLERFSFVIGNNLFIGSDISFDLFSGFMPTKLIKLISKSFYNCKFHTYIDTAAQEYLGDFFSSKEYKSPLTTIRYKKLNVISSYAYKSLQDNSYRKELKNQLKIFITYYYFIKKYNDDFLRFAGDVVKCNLQFSLVRTEIPKIKAKILSEDKGLIVFTKNLKKYYSRLPVKVNSQIKEVPLQNAICNNSFCNLYIEDAQKIKVDPEYKILRLLDKTEVIPSFQALSLNRKIKIKIVSSSKREWKILDDFIKTISKFVEIEYEGKGSADLIVLIHNGKLNFFEKEAKKELPCIHLYNGILYNKVMLSEQLFGIISCKDMQRVKTLIFAPTFYHLYLFSADEIRKTAWKSIWIWNKKRLIFSDDILEEVR